MKNAPTTATVYLASENMVRGLGAATCFLRPGSRGFMIKFAMRRQPRLRYAPGEWISEEGEVGRGGLTRSNPIHKPNRDKEPVEHDGEDDPTDAAPDHRNSHDDTSSAMEVVCEDGNLKIAHQLRSSPASSVRTAGKKVKPIPTPIPTACARKVCQYAVQSVTMNRLGEV